MKSAYYSRNNSYSRSYNAECAQEEGRYPLIRAAKKIGCSLAIFKEAIANDIISTDEWHHVSKFANKVNYYDTVAILEDIEFLKFWLKRTKIKAKRTYILSLCKPIVCSMLWSRLSGTVVTRNPKFAKKLTELCKKPEQLRSIVNYLKNNDREGKVWVSTGTRQEEEVRVGYYGEEYNTGRSIICIDGGYVVPFDLTPENIRKLMREISIDKAKRKAKMLEFSGSILTKWDKIVIKKILDHKIRGKIMNNSLVNCTSKQNLIAGKIAQNLYSNLVSVEFKNNGAYISRLK